MHSEEGRRLWVVLLAVLGVFALVAAACGNDDDDAPAPIVDDGTEEPSGDGAEEPSEDVELTAAEAAAARIAPLFEAPTTIGPTEALASLPTGANVAWLGIGTENEATAIREFRAAAGLLGFEVTEFAAGFDAAGQVAALEEAASQNFDVVVVTSFTEAAATSPQMRAVKDSGALIVAYGTALPGRTNELMDYQFLSKEDSQKWGTLLADWVVADSGGTAKVLATFPPDFAAGNAQHEGFVAHIEATCPDCEVVPLDFSLAEIGTELPSRIVSSLQADSEIDYVSAAFGAVFIGVPEALDEAGLSDQVTGIGYYGTAFNQQLIVDGRFQVMSQDVGNPYRGYMLADATARLLAGQEIEDWSDLFYEPLQFSTADNIDDPTTDCLCAPADFREQFHAVWGVGDAHQVSPEVAAAQERTNAILAKPDSIGITEPLAALPTGAKVAWLGIGTENEAASLVDFRIAADLLGFEVTEFAAGFDVAGMVGVLEEVATQDFDVVIMVSFATAALGPQLTAVDETGALIISYGVGEPGFTPDRIDHNFYALEDAELYGSMLADWVVADSGGDAKILGKFPPDFAAGVAQQRGLEAQIAAICPGCSVVPMEFSITEIGTDLPGRIVSALQADPDINYLVATFGQSLVGVPEALAEAGLQDRVRGITANGIALTNQQIVGDTFMKATLDFGPPYRGYLLADAAARLFVGQDVPTEVYLGTFMPIRLHTADNIENPDIDSPGAPDDFREQFHALWGVG